MVQYQIITPVGQKLIKTDAESAQVEQAVEFVKKSGESTISKLLQALRLLGHKATEVNTEAVDIFEL